MGTLLAIPELKRPGVYFLIGSDPETEKPKAYIGEAEDVALRLKSQKHKEFWNTAIAIVSKDENLTKAHVRYLEGRLIEIALDVGRFDLDNSCSSGAVLPVSDQSDMESFLRRVQQLFPVLGSDLFTPLAPAGKKAQFTCKVGSIVARGDRTPNGFVVYKSSTAALKDRPSALAHSASAVALRQKLQADGTLIQKGSKLVFTRDTEFSSPSSAAAVVCGGSGPGPLLWRDGNNKTLKEIEESN